jgi:hypothetical protein
LMSWTNIYYYLNIIHFNLNCINIILFIFIYFFFLS